MQFYTYQHRSADTNQVFYIGKGKGERLLDKNKRGKYWKYYTQKHGFTAEKIADNLDEELAFLVEMEAIDAYRRRGIKLINLTDGGEGCTGYSHPHSEESRAKMSKARIGNKNKLGKKVSDETKQKMSNAKKGCVVKARRVLSDEQVSEIRAKLGYRNIAKLAKEFGVGESTIRRVRSGERYKEII